MKKTVATAAAIALLLLATAPPASADWPAEPSDANCPVGYNPTSIANLCVFEPESNPDTREACLVGDVCLDIPIILDEDGKFPKLVYFDAFCALQGVTCGCSYLADGFIRSCTPLQMNGEPDPSNPDEPGRDDNVLLIQEGDNCLPTTYEEEAFANVCIVLAPEWGTGISMSQDQFCVIGDICNPELVGFTDGDGLPAVAAIYVDALCNLPAGCGCGIFLHGLLMLCSPLQS